MLVLRQADSRGQIQREKIVIYLPSCKVNIIASCTLRSATQVQTAYTSAKNSWTWPQMLDETAATTAAISVDFRGSQDAYHTTLVTSATLVVTGALLVVTRSY